MYTCSYFERSQHQKEKKNVNDNANAQDISNASSLLLPCDFEIGKELGDTEERKRIYVELEELIGMERAKEWLRKIRQNVDNVKKMTCLGVLKRGEQGEDNGTSLKEGRVIAIETTEENKARTMEQV